jgi:hypothetical protein
VGVSNTINQFSISHHNQQQQPSHTSLSLSSNCLSLLSLIHSLTSTPSRAHTLSRRRRSPVPAPLTAALSCASHTPLSRDLFCNMVRPIAVGGLRLAYRGPRSGRAASGLSSPPPLTVTADPQSTAAKRRLIRDFKRLATEAPEGISGSPCQDNIMVWNAVIFGPRE